MPEGMDMTATLDESRFIRNSIRNVAVAGLTGATLAALAVLLFLGSLRQTFIIVTAIPLAIADGPGLDGACLAYRSTSLAWGVWPWGSASWWITPL
jgi:hypothetical protein